MLITCFQCRQQLDVPDDSAGKRIRCPHCTYVIVAPPKATPSSDESSPPSEPALGLPSMDLDGDAPPTPVSTPRKSHVPTQPLPPMPLPPVEASQPKRTEPEEDLCAPPSIERGARRRGPVGPTAAPRTGSSKALLILGFIAALGVGAIIGGIVVNESRRPQAMPPMVFRPPMPQDNLAQPFQPMQDPLRPNFLPNGNLGRELWHDFKDYERRLVVTFPFQPMPKQLVIGPGFMTGHESRDGEWEYSILYRRMTLQDFQANTPLAHFTAVERSLSDNLKLVRDGERAVPLSGIHPGREWDFTTPEGRKLFARSFLVADGTRYHQYVLTASGPANPGPGNQPLHRYHFQINRFFHSFVPMIGLEGTNSHVGQTVYEELDDTENGSRRDNEFFSIAVHPKKPIAVVGSIASQITVTQPNLSRQFAPGDGRAIEQTVISPEGVFLAVATGLSIHVWKDWDAGGVPVKLRSVPGHCCAISKDHRLFAASKNSVKAFDLHTTKLVASLDIKDMNVQGLALANDGRTLATYDEKSIALWDWNDKKLYGQFDAHDALITTVAFSPDGKTLASASADRTIKLWDVETRTELATLKQHAWTVWALAFTPDGRHLASGGLDGMLLIWDMQPATPSVVWAQANQFPVRGVTFDGDGKHCYMTCKQPVTANGKAGHQYRRQVRKIAWSDIKLSAKKAEKIAAQCAGLHLPTCDGAAYVARDNNTIVTTSDHVHRHDGGQRFGPHAISCNVRVWDAATALQKHVLQAMPGSVLSPDGKWLAYAPPGQNVSLHVLEVATRSTSAPLFVEVNAMFPSVFFSADSKHLWMPTKDEMIRYELPKPQVLGKGVFSKVVPVVERQRINIKEPSSQGFMRVSTSLDHKQFLVEVSGFDAGLRKRRLFDALDGREMQIPKNAPGERSGFLRIRFMDDEIGSVELEDVTQGRTDVVGRIGPQLQGTAVHPGGKLAAVVGSEHGQLVRVHLWDLDAQKPILTVPEPFARTSYSVRFSRDGSQMAWVTNAGWTRIVPTDWLLDRKGLLTCDLNEVAGP